MKKDGEEYGNYMAEGMRLGMMAGTIWGGNALTYGIFLGLVIGMLIIKR